MNGSSSAISRRGLRWAGWACVHSGAVNAEAAKPAGAASGVNAASKPTGNAAIGANLIGKVDGPTIMPDAKRKQWRWFDVQISGLAYTRWAEERARAGGNPDIYVLICRDPLRVRVVAYQGDQVGPLGSGDYRFSGADGCPLTRRFFSIRVGPSPSPEASRWTS